MFFLQLGDIPFHLNNSSLEQDKKPIMSSWEDKKAASDACQLHGDLLEV